MSQNYPIWHQVQACHYKSSKSYGGRTDSGETIYVGTSAKHSHVHCTVLTTKREINHPEFGNCFIFRTSVDNIVVKESLFSIKDKQLVQQISKLTI